MRIVALLALSLIANSGLANAQDQPAQTMAGAARAFLATLDPAQKAQAVLPFNSEERFHWFYTPVARRGIPLKSLTPAQNAAALNLLRAGLSEKGYSKAETIRQLETVLREIEGGRGPARDPELYFFTFFGEPMEGGAPTWGWRYEGHHCSQNWTIVNGKSIASSPQFFGAHPAEVREGPMKGTRVLRVEEDLGYSLLQSLTEAQRSQAVLPGPAPADIVTRNERKAAIQADTGITYAALNHDQQGTPAGADRGISQRTASRAGAATPRQDPQRRAGHDYLCLDGRSRTRHWALLPGPGQNISHRVRQHPEQRQPHPLCVARLQRRLGRGPS